MCNINGKRSYLVTSKEYAEQREKIIKLSGKAVICIETGKVYYGENNKKSLLICTFCYPKTFLNSTFFI